MQPTLDRARGSVRTEDSIDTASRYSRAQRSVLARSVAAAAPITDVGQ